jgi:hypothetical protein
MPTHDTLRGTKIGSNRSGICAVSFVTCFCVLYEPPDATSQQLQSPISTLVFIATDIVIFIVQPETILQSAQIIFHLPAQSCIANIVLDTSTRVCKTVCPFGPKVAVVFTSWKVAIEQCDSAELRVAFASTVLQTQKEIVEGWELVLGA